MKRFGAPKVGSGGVGKPERIAELDVSVYVWEDILRELSFGLLLLVAGHRG
jgi:hypothetical protein